MVVSWSEPAKYDLKSIHQYISQDSIYYAEETVEVLLDAVIKLHIFPNQGRIVPEIDNPAIRELLITPYRIIYEVTMAGIFILAIVHMRKRVNKKTVF